MGVLGLDEISMKKGYRNFVTLFTDRVDDKVSALGVVKRHKKSNTISVLRIIPSFFRNSISAVCCDLYHGYKRSL
ncbi:transposase [Shewanella surugensis]|uniref:transposase n=1 Tax=Shewanella surugensis TaxID=212020 RepID=UPI0035DEA2AA